MVPDAPGSAADVIGSFADAPANFLDAPRSVPIASGNFLAASASVAAAPALFPKTISQEEFLKRLASINNAAIYSSHGWKKASGSAGRV
jgi:hypothetical protein